MRRRSNKEIMFQKVILFLDSLLVVSFSPKPLLSIWNSNLTITSIVKFTLGIIVGVCMLFMMFTSCIAPLYTDMINLVMILNYRLIPGDDLLVVCRCITAVVIHGILEMIVLLLYSISCGLIINLVWLQARCSDIFLLPFHLLHIWYVLLVKGVPLLLMQLGKFLGSKLLVYTGVLQGSMCNGKPDYVIDTTQKHYPRKRIRSFQTFSGHPSQGLLAGLFLPDDYDDNCTEEGGDIPDVEELPGNHCICSYLMRLQPQDEFYSFVVYFCECREDDAFYEVCSAFDIPENIREKIATNNSSIIIRCFDTLHRVCHRNNELTLTMIKTQLSEYSDELRQIVSDYHMNE